jgi:tRNA modification GTPase
MIFPDTIFALSSGRLPSGVAIIRLSGSNTRFAIETIAGSVPAPRLARYGPLRDPGGAIIDWGLNLFFPAPQSFTGEDVGEFHVHGGKAVVAAFLGCLSRVQGLRHAEAGEFTRRAFLNGKVDLLQAEALADLVSAETESQRRFALENARGGQAELYLSWRQRLIYARAMIEAGIDFADEADVRGSVSTTIWNDVELLIDEIDDHLQGYRKAEILRDGFDVVIVGAPNAGKSSLLNALARRDVAIVTDQPGTTRDLIEIALDIDGLKVRVTDTAGMREDADVVESIGIGRALDRARSADLVLHVVDMVLPEPVPRYAMDIDGPRVGTKADLLGEDELAARSHDYDCTISAKSGDGLERLLRVIGTRAAMSADVAVGDLLPSRERHVALLRETLSLLKSSLVARSLGEEIQAETLRLAAAKLGRISGAADVEDLLDVIFSQFCIGK